MNPFPNLQGLFYSERNITQRSAEVRGTLLSTPRRAEQGRGWNPSSSTAHVGDDIINIHARCVAIYLSIWDHALLGRYIYIFFC